MEIQQMFSKKFHFQQRSSLQPTTINKNSMFKEFQVPLRENEVKVSRAGSRYEQHKNQQSETSSPFSPFQAQLNLNSANGSHLPASERKVIYHKLVPQTTRVYQNLDRNLKSKAKIGSHGYTNSQSYLSPTSRDINYSQRIEPAQNRNLLKSKSYQVYQQIASNNRKSLKKRQTSPYNKQIEKKLNHKDSSKSFKSDKLYHKKVQQEQNMMEERDYLKYTKSAKYYKPVDPSGKAEYCTFTNFEMTQVQKKNEELQIKIKSLEKEVLSFRVSLKEWCGAENSYQQQIAVLKQTIKEAKLQNLKLNEKMVVKNNSQVYQNSVLQRVSQENMILIKQIKEGKDMQIRQIKELKQRQKEDQRQYQTIIQNLQKQATIFKVNQLLEIKKQLDRYLAVNKQLQKLLEEEKSKNIDLKCKNEEAGSTKDQNQRQFQSITKELQLTKKHHMDTQKIVQNLEHEKQQQEMKVKDLTKKINELANLNCELERGENILKEQFFAIQKIDKQKIKQLQELNSRLQADFVKQQQIMEKKYHSIRSDVDKSNQRMAIQAQFKLTLSKKEEQLIAQKNARIEANIKLKTLQEQYSQLKKNLQNSQLRQTDLQNKVKSLTQTIVSLQRNNIILVEENIRMKSQINLVQKMNIQQEIKLTNDHIQRMNMEIDYLRKQNQSSTKRHHQDMENLTQNKDHVIAELEKIVYQHQRHIHHLQQAANNAQMQLQQSQSALLSDLRKLYSKVNLQIEQILEQINQLKNRLTNMNTSIIPMLSKLQIQCERYEGMEKKFEDNTKDVCEVICYLQQQNQQLFQELKNNNVSIANKFTNATFTNANHKIQKVKVDNNGQSVAKSLMKENDNLLQMIGKVQCEKTELESRNKEGLEMIKHLQTRLLELQVKSSSQLISLGMGKLNKKYEGA